MKVAISSAGPSLDAAVDPRFGRCQFFMIVDLDNMGFEAVPNASSTLEGGAGIQAAKAVVDRGAESVLTGYVGPKAQQVLSTAGLHTVTGVSGTVRDVAQEYKEGTSTPLDERSLGSGVDARQDQPDVQMERSFQASLPGVGMGRGCGRGRGGQGRGFGFGMGGYCVCPNCGERVLHEPGRSCFEERCPKCGAAMTLEQVI